MPTTTDDLARDLGLSYRQVDYLTRNGTITEAALSGGSGSRRDWPADVVVRLHVAKALHDAAPWLPFTVCAKAVMANALLPPAKGLVVLKADGTVWYVDDPISLVAALEDGGTVASYRLPHCASTLP